MTNPAKQPSQSYTALVQQVVREAEEPIPVAEIMRRIHYLRLIESRSSPERVIRSAISQCRLVANTGDGKYWWYPRLLKGSRVRVSLIPSDLERRRIVFDDDARDLLWPSFFAGHEQTDRKPIELRLPAGDCASLPLEHFGGSEWGTTGSPKFWNWLRACEAAGADAMILEASDAEASIETKASKAWIIKPTVSGVKREVQYLLKIGILAKYRRRFRRVAVVTRASASARARRAARFAHNRVARAAQANEEAGNREAASATKPFSGNLRQRAEC